MNLAVDGGAGLEIEKALKKNQSIFMTIFQIGIKPLLV